MRFCSYCGQPLDPVTQECPVCGGYKTQDLSDKFVETLKGKLCSPLMLIFCILTSATVLAEMFASESPWSQIFGLLMPIALWITYFSACSRKADMSLGGLKFASVCITISKVVIWIVIALLLLTSIIVLAAPSFLGDYISNLTYAFPEYELYVDMFFGGASSLVLIIGIILLVATVILILMNIFYLGNISKSIKSVIESFKTGENRLRKHNSVKIWLIVGGCIECIYAFGNMSWQGALDAVNLFVGAIVAGMIANIPSEKEL